MTSSERFQLLIAGMSFLFVLMSAVLGMVWRNGNKQGTLNEKISGLAEDVKQIAEDVDKHIRWHLDRNHK